MDLSFDSAIELAFSSRNRWNTGEISRYEVVEEFVDGLLANPALDCHGNNATFDGERLEEWDKYDSNSTQSELELRENSHILQHVLPRINVITSVWNRESIPSRHVQKPTSIEHLRRMLVQTTWM